jgi:hypothetical protein
VQELVKKTNKLAEAFNKEEKQQEEMMSKTVQQELQKLGEEWKNQMMQTVTAPLMPEKLKNIPQLEAKLGEEMVIQMFRKGLSKETALLILIALASPYLILFETFG